MTRKRQFKLGGAFLALAGAGTLIFSACSGITNKDVHSKPDATVCIYDKEDGKLIKQLPPGANKAEVEGDAVLGQPRGGIQQITRHSMQTLSFANPLISGLDDPRDRREAHADILDTPVFPGSIVKTVALVAAALLAVVAILFLAGALYSWREGTKDEEYALRACQGRLLPLVNIRLDEENGGYKATNDRRVVLFPGSVLFKRDDSKKKSKARTFSRAPARTRDRTPSGCRSKP